MTMMAQTAMTMAKITLSVFFLRWILPTKESMEGSLERKVDSFTAIVLRFVHHIRVSRSPYIDSSDSRV